eukprot:CAMPEP_0206146218 /NCGR_PEP_ID=MMETSP1473-20131121/29726_1 /ASSEMBLY_ACC=CAM_ASM_001109 /TAXON_ID=1461547 /ORGANISM="Stichococcus sp, Strain RCC1054" /LENGTH=85 /DNA_ID=CAMNT_0053542695 /DNA_START=97 /DNA_END=351 /DNA_ORIENTATION=+
MAGSAKRILNASHIGAIVQRSEACQFASGALAHDPTASQASAHDPSRTFLMTLWRPATSMLRRQQITPPSASVFLISAGSRGSPE